MSDQRRSTLIAVVGLLLVFGAGAYLAATALLGGSLPLVPTADRVAVLPVEGVITPGASERVLGSLRRFEDDGSVQAYVLEIRSPGGTVGASQSLYGEIRRRRDEGERAERLGLVDGTATLSEAIARAGRMAGLGEDPRTVRPRRERPGLLELLLGEGTPGLGEHVFEWATLAAEASSPRLLYLWR